MNYSFSTLLMAVLASNLLIAVMALCFRNRRVMLSIGYRLVIVFLLLTALRFLIPVEMPFSRNIYLPEWLSVPIALIRHNIFTFGIIRISASSLLGCAWIGGVACCLWKNHRCKKEVERFLCRYARNKSAKEPYSGMMAKICGKRRNPLRILEVPYFGAPMQYGTLRPCIVIPETLGLSREELYYVLRHEAAHYYHHDALIKDAVRLICAFYWWNPFCRHLRARTDLLLEMRVDGALVDGDAADREAYCRTLDRIRAKLSRGVSASDSNEAVPMEMSTADGSAAVSMEISAPDSSAAISMAVSGARDLKYRENMMYREKGKRSPLFLLLAALAAAGYIGSYSFTIEAYTTLPQDKAIAGAASENCFYAIQQEDGTYNIYYEGLPVDNVVKLDQYIGIEIRTE